MQSHSHHLPNDPSLEFASLPPLVNYGPNGESNLNDNIDMNDPTRRLVTFRINHMKFVLSIRKCKVHGQLVRDSD